MPNHYIEDYESMTGKQRESEPDPQVVETKMVEAPKAPPVKSSDVQVETA